MIHHQAAKGHYFSDQVAREEHKDICVGKRYLLSLSLGGHVGLSSLSLYNHLPSWRVARGGERKIHEGKELYLNKIGSCKEIVRLLG